MPEDILDEISYVEKMMLVRFRIISVFEKSVDPKTKKGIHGNYLVGVGPKKSQLNRFLVTKINHRGIFTREDLHPEYKNLSSSLRETAFSRMLKVMIERNVNQMYDDCDLWWLWSHGGIWEIAQSLVDEQRMLRETLVANYSNRQKYRDERSFHGRPSNQGRRRVSQLRTAPGISVGF